QRQRGQHQQPAVQSRERELGAVRERQPQCERHGLSDHRPAALRGAVTCRRTIMNQMMKRGLIALALAALPCTALADNTCNGYINIDYVGAPPVSNIGDVVRMKITFGTGNILGGTKLTINSFEVDLDCNANFPLVPPCTDEGAIIEYEGD